MDYWHKGEYLINMTKNLAMVSILVLLFGCRKMNAIHDFESCLKESELQSYSRLVSLCDDFIIANFPDENLEGGYEQYLTDSEEFLLNGEPSSKLWDIDTARVLKMNRELENVFAEYDGGRGIFGIYSSIMLCLKEANKLRVSTGKFAVDNLLDGHERAGDVSPGWAAGVMLSTGLNPSKGIEKTIFVTEVLWPTLYAGVKR